MENLEYKKTDQELKSYRDTIKEIYRLARLYHLDLLNFYEDSIPIHTLSPKQFFDFIQNKEYVKDPSGIEYVNRPRISLEKAGSGHPFDCDDRTVLCLSYLMLNNQINKMFGKKEFYDYRVLVVGRGTKPHHVYCEYKTENSDWIPFDPTYPHNQFGKALFEPIYKTIHYERDYL